MSNVGRMDGAFFVSRGELLAWANSAFRLSLSKVEQCSNGAVYCQVIDACHEGRVMMKKVNWNARADHEAIPNYKILQQAFDKNGIQRHIEVDKLIRGKYQDNLEMLQWIKTYYDRTFQGGEYDPMARRFGDTFPDWARSSDGGAMAGRPPSEPAPRRSDQGVAKATRDGPSAGRGGPPAAGYGGPAASGSGMGTAPVAPAGVAAHAPSVSDLEQVREEVVDLKITVDGLETERDFYFQKLRDIEILCQTLEANPDPHMTVAKFVEDVQRILYARDDDA